MTRALFDTAFKAARALHIEHSAVSEFTAWDDTAKWAKAAPHPTPCAQRLTTEAALAQGASLSARAPFTALAPHARWRETYTDAEMFNGFNARFGSFQLIGREGHFFSETTSSFVLYSDKDLWYPWHDHPAEELYLIVAGEAEFFAKGRPPQSLRPGDACYHASGQPHAMQTHTQPVLAYVLWRGDIRGKPRLTRPDRVPEG